MEFLQSIFSFAPVTTSAIVLITTAAIICIASYLILTMVKFIINEKAWEKEIIDSKIIIDKILKIVVHKLYEKVIIHNDNIYTLSKYKDKYYLWRCGNEGLDLTEGCVRPWNLICFESYVTTYKTKEEALNNLLITEQRSLQLKFNKLWLLLPLLLDAGIMIFGYQPTATMWVVGISSLIYSVRWVSGKLAENVGKTDNHEERITKLEDKEK